MTTADLKRTVYPDYASYRRDQASKLDLSNGEAYTDPAAQEQQFVIRFVELPIPTGQRVLCVGARRGEEVRAWRSLGHTAIGIDFNPGANNPDVQIADFHTLPFPEGHFTVVYSNSLDHAFDWMRAVAEWRRVLSPEGWLVLDLVRGYAEGYQTGGRDCLHWPTAYGMAKLVASVLEWDITQHKDLLTVEVKDVLQVVLRSPAPMKPPYPEA